MTATRMLFWTVVSALVVGLAFLLAHFWGANTAYWTCMGLGAAAVVAGLVFLWRRKTAKERKKIGWMHRLALVFGVLTILVFTPGAIGYGIWGVFTILLRPHSMHELVVDAARNQQSVAAFYRRHPGGAINSWAVREFGQAGKKPARTRPSELERVQAWPFVLPFASAGLMMFCGAIAMGGAFRRAIAGIRRRFAPPRDFSFQVGGPPGVPTPTPPAPAGEAHVPSLARAVWHEVLFFIRRLPVEIFSEWLFHH